MLWGGSTRISKAKDLNGDGIQTGVQVMEIHPCRILKSLPGNLRYGIKFAIMKSMWGKINKILNKQILLIFYIFNGACTNNVAFNCDRFILLPCNATPPPTPTKSSP